MAVCIAVVGKDNGPLFFRTAGRKGEGQQQGAINPNMGGGTDMTDLQYSFVVSSALDIVEERVAVGHHHFKGGNVGNPLLGGGGGVVVSSATGDAPPIATRELYLGALTAQEDYKVYGYMTNTKIKFIIIVEETSGVPLRENDIRMMFRKLHSAFCDLMSNPFYLPGTEIHSKRFEGIVNSILVAQ